MEACANSVDVAVPMHSTVVKHFAATEIAAVQLIKHVDTLSFFFFSFFFFFFPSFFSFFFCLFVPFFCLFVPFFFFFFVPFFHLFSIVFSCVSFVVFPFFFSFGFSLFFSLLFFLFSPLFFLFFSSLFFFSLFSLFLFFICFPSSFFLLFFLFFFSFFFFFLFFHFVPFFHFFIFFPFLLAEHLRSLQYFFVFFSSDLLRSDCRAVDRLRLLPQSPSFQQRLTVSAARLELQPFFSSSVPGRCLLFLRSVTNETPRYVCLPVFRWITSFSLDPFASSFPFLQQPQPRLRACGHFTLFLSLGRHRPTLHAF